MLRIASAQFVLTCAPMTPMMLAWWATTAIVSHAAAATKPPAAPVMSATSSDGTTPATTGDAPAATPAVGAGAPTPDPAPPTLDSAAVPSPVPGGATLAAPLHASSVAHSAAAAATDPAAGRDVEQASRSPANDAEARNRRCADPSLPPHIRVMCGQRDAGGLRFGSYGRVGAGTDLRGGAPQSANIVARGPRIVEGNYLELEFSYGMNVARPGAHFLVRPVMTLAVADPLFHDSGDFASRTAVRNLYLEVWSQPGTVAYSLWAGSRMYRGDDSYLFDEWPLDDLNTVGAGGQVVWRDRYRVLAHAGTNRLKQPFFVQDIEVAHPEQGATTVTQLNRQRMVASLTAEGRVWDQGPGGWALKVKLHTEWMGIGEGVRRRGDGSFEALPADAGFRVGAQVGGWHNPAADDPEQPRPYRRFANAFVRYSRGLAAYDELATPTVFGRDLRTTAASEFTAGAIAGWDAGWGNALVATKMRRFIDADRNSTDADDGWEYAVDARPLVRLAPAWFAGADLSYQAKFPRGLNPLSQVAADPAVTQLAPMLVFAPMGGRAFDRPQLRLVYRAAHLNQAALDLFAPEDVRHHRPWVHYLGVMAEWWFDSSSGR